MPHTGVLPHPCSAADLKRLGTVIKWTTNDPSVLKDLHQAIVSVVREVGISGLVDFATAAKAFGGAGFGIEAMVQMAAQDAIECPIPAKVLKFIKGFQ
ncbi:MAG TPA: hypothetical protein VFU37_09465 [Pyrinomonadaceae bacterium]|jgi:hypothetical protein|nr:hypothetical protein [Pyrinomonadaceae bacterium]